MYIGFASRSRLRRVLRMYQNYWRPWEDSMRPLWVREKPENCYTKEDFDFYTDDLWDYEFQIKFAEWLHKRNAARRTCCLIGIRTQESFNRCYIRFI